MNQDLISKILTFDINKIHNYVSIVIIGSKGSGKTTLIKDILRSKKDTTRNSIVFGLDSEKQYKTITPSPAKHEVYLDEKVSKFIRNSIINFDKKDTKSCSYFILDDCYTTVYPVKNLENVIHKGRHYKISSILGITSHRDISHNTACNMDYVFIFKNSDEDERKKYITTSLMVVLTI